MYYTSENFDHEVLVDKRKKCFIKFLSFNRDKCEVDVNPDLAVKSRLFLNLLFIQLLICKRQSYGYQDTYPLI